MMGEMHQAGRCGPGSRAINAMLPSDHLLRRVDRLLDMAELRAALASHYSARGRPSIDPELLIRMALIGRLYAIPSERRLCEEVHYNFAYRWFCRLTPGAAIPHHSTFSKNRHGRFREAGVFRLLFENTVRRCIAAGLVAGKDAAIDASFIAADASWQRKMRLPIYRTFRSQRRSRVPCVSGLRTRRSRRCRSMAPSGVPKSRCREPIRHRPGRRARCGGGSAMRSMF